MNVVDRRSRLTRDAESAKTPLRSIQPRDQVDEFVVERNLFSDETVGDRTYAESRTGNFAACLTRGPLTEGHSLLYARLEVCSLASATVRRDLYEEHCAFLTGVVSFLGEKFKSPVFQFEHGMPSGSLHGGCGTTRAHSHLLPSSLPARELIDLDPQPWSRLTDMATLRSVVATGCAYLAVRDGAGNAFFRAVGRTEMLPSQYLRSLFWTCSPSVRSFDWRDDSRDISIILDQAQELRGEANAKLPAALASLPSIVAGVGNRAR